LVAVIWYENALPTVPLAVVALVITGAGLVRLIVAPVAVMVSRVAPGTAPIALLIGIESEVLLVAEVIVAVTTATTPLPSVVEFIPLATHVTDPVLEAQVSVLFAAVSADPAVILREVTSLAG